ncbi:MAG: hypothetical protein JO002_07210 [Burkholderiaceae bacterium]|nr:hypothetical protein [Burkholderiaceae bacterium]
MLLNRFGMFGEYNYVTEFLPKLGRMKLANIDDERSSFEFSLECGKDVCDMVFDVATE